MISQDSDLLRLDPSLPSHVEIHSEEPGACPSLGEHLVAGAVDLQRPTESLLWIDPGHFEVLPSCDAFGLWMCDSRPPALPARPGSCRVTDAFIRFGPQPDEPLRLPYEYAVPRPGISDLGERRQTGFSHGPVPSGDPNSRGLKSRRDWLGAAFEFHANLNNAHGCRSRQDAWAEVTEYEDERAVRTVPFPTAPAPDGYQGDTHRGHFQLDDAVVYEASTRHIHWLDTPGVVTTRQRATSGSPIRSARQRLLLRSTVYDADGRGGWYCMSAHEAWLSQHNGEALGDTPRFKSLGCRPFGHPLGVAGGDAPGSARSSVKEAR